jgi:hypothetical protein
MHLPEEAVLWFDTKVLAQPLGDHWPEYDGDIDHVGGKAKSTPEQLMPNSAHGFRFVRADQNKPAFRVDVGGVVFRSDHRDPVYDGTRPTEPIVDDKFGCCRGKDPPQLVERQTGAKYRQPTAGSQSVRSKILESLQIARRRM